MPGVYAIVNKENGKIYIGSTIQPFLHRWSKHLYHLRHNQHKNPHLQSSWNKYGEDAFEFKILQKTPRDEILFYEQKWLDFYRTKREVYNFGKIVQNGMLGRSHSNETRQKISRNIREKNWWLGKRHSEDTKRKMSEAQKGKVVSEETRKKLSEALSGENNPNYGKPNPRRGKKLPEEWRLKIKRNTPRGENHPWYGKHLRKEMRRKISETLKGRKLPDWHKSRISEGMRGRKHSEETKQKIGEGSAKKYPALINEMTGEIIPPGKNIAKMCRENGLDNSSICSLVRGELKRYKNWVLRD